MAKSNHMPGGGDVKALWGRSSDYREQAKKGIRAKKDRLDVYDSEQLLSATLAGVQPRPVVSSTGAVKNIAPGSKEHMARYKLSAFISGGSPYPNHVHHMIPANDFIGRFTAEQQDILWRVEYNVNNGNNLIFLPATLDATRYHLLPWHQTDDFHRPYSKEVKESASEIEDKINKVLDKKEPCKELDVPTDIKDELVNYENSLWDLIVGLGPKSINEIKMPKKSANKGSLK